MLLELGLGVGAKFQETALRILRQSSIKSSIQNPAQFLLSALMGANVDPWFLSWLVLGLLPRHSGPVELGSSKYDFAVRAPEVAAIWAMSRAE